MSKLSDNGFNLLKTLFETEDTIVLYPFIIDEKRVHMQFSKHNFTTFIAVVKVSEHFMPYEYWCLPNSNTPLKIYFKSPEDFNEKVEKLVICKYHANCGELINGHSGQCADLFLTSPTTICGICHEMFEYHLLQETACKHLFCLKCLNAYVTSRPNKCCTSIPCPMCRTDLKQYSHTHFIEFHFDHLMVD